jgi:hypothetical protein
LKDILQVNTEGPFCFNISLPQTIIVLFTTCNQVQLQHKTHSVFNWQMLWHEYNRFFGIGERKGTFFLQNHTTYALYNNDNNALPSYQGDLHV